jgi:hypothetical protein
MSQCKTLPHYSIKKIDEVKNYTLNNEKIMDAKFFYFDGIQLKKVIHIKYDEDLYDGDVYEVIKEYENKEVEIKKIDTTNFNVVKSTRGNKVSVNFYEKKEDNEIIEKDCESEISDCESLEEPICSDCFDRNPNCTSCCELLYNDYSDFDNDENEEPNCSVCCDRNPNCTRCRWEEYRYAKMIEKINI